MELLSGEVWQAKAMPLYAASFNSKRAEFAVLSQQFGERECRRRR
jgi:hypothetical protein